MIGGIYRMKKSEKKFFLDFLKHKTVIWPLGAKWSFDRFPNGQKKFEIFLTEPADFGLVRTASSDRNRGQKTEFWTGFRVFEPEPEPEPIKIRFRFGPRNSEPWTEPEPDKKKFQIFLTEPELEPNRNRTETDRFSQKNLKFFLTVRETVKWPFCP